MGFASRMVYEHFGHNDPSAIKKVTSRFTSHVYPGETLVVRMWKESNKVYFEGHTKEREQKVVLKGTMEFNDEY